MKANRKFSNFASDENAISPVIGTILMVAVTVILAAVIAAFVFGFTGVMPKAPKVSYFDLSRGADGNIVITNNAPAIANVSGVQILAGPTGEAVDDSMLIGYTAGGDVGINQLNTLYGSITIDATKCTDTATNPCHIVIYGSVNGATKQVIEDYSL